MTNNRRIPMGAKTHPQCLRYISEPIKKNTKQVWEQLVRLNVKLYTIINS